MVKNFSILLILGISIALLSGCGGSNPTMEGPQRDAVLVYSEPIADNLISGLQSGDYRVFSRDLNEQMLTSLDNNAFIKLQDQLSGLFGTYQSRTVDKVVDYGKIVTVFYNGVFEKNPKVQISITITKDEPHLIRGLWFK